MHVTCKFQARRPAQPTAPATGVDQPKGVPPPLRQNRRTKLESPAHIRTSKRQDKLRIGPLSWFALMGWGVIGWMPEAEHAGHAWHSPTSAGSSRPGPAHPRRDAPRARTWLYPVQVTQTKAVCPVPGRSRRAVRVLVSKCDREAWLCHAGQVGPTPNHGNARQRMKALDLNANRHAPAS